MMEKYQEVIQLGIDPRDRNPVGSTATPPKPYFNCDWLRSIMSNSKWNRLQLLLQRGIIRLRDLKECDRMDSTFSYSVLHEILYESGPLFEAIEQGHVLFSDLIQVEMHVAIRLTTTIGIEALREGVFCLKDYFIRTPVDTRDYNYRKRNLYTLLQEWYRKRENQKQLLKLAEVDKATEQYKLEEPTATGYALCELKERISNTSNLLKDVTDMRTEHMDCLDRLMSVQKTVYWRMTKDPILLQNKHLRLRLLSLQQTWTDLDSTSADAVNTFLSSDEYTTFEHDMKSYLPNPKTVSTDILLNNWIQLSRAIDVVRKRYQTNPRTRKNAPTTNTENDDNDEPSVKRAKLNE